MIRPTTAPPSSVLDIPVQDWDALYAAILERLTLVAGRQLATDPSLHHLLLESVDALTKLRVALDQERALRQLVEAHVKPAQPPLPLAIRQLLGLGAMPMTIDLSRRAGARYPSVPNNEFP